ncbi:MAG: amino acid permease [Cellulomonas sp.]|nr:amino acid permease [Cellulomonas sp.]
MADDAQLAAPARLGLPQATSMVVGTIIGVGIFNLPGSLAGFGPIALVAMGPTTLGAVALALMFASLARRMPADGGPYAYARAAFGNLVGFTNAWLYWIPCWAGNAAIATGWVLYVERFINTTHHPAATVALTLAGLWGAAAINLMGVGAMGRIQLWTSVLKFVPLLAMATIGLLFIDGANFEVLNRSGMPPLQAVTGAMALCLFSYIGVEAASVAAAKVRDPRRNVPRATVLGTLAAAIVYVLSLVAVMGIVPAAELTTSTAPFATAAQSMAGQWAGTLMAALVVVSGFGALNGWTMLAAEMPLAAANDGLFPDRFRTLSRRGVPAFGILTSTLLSTVVVVLSHIGASGIAVFDTLILMTGIAAAIPYAFSALAQLRWRWADRRVVRDARLVRDLLVATVSLVVSVLFVVYSRNTDESGFATWQPFLYAAGALALGVPVYLRMRPRMAPPPPPPPLRTAAADVEAVDA